MAIEGQGGSDFTYRTAAVVRDFGISEDKAEILLHETGWNRACQPPWDAGELAALVAHVYQYAKRPAGEARNPDPDSLELMAAMAKADEASTTQEVEKPKNPFAVKWREEVEAMEDPAWLIEDVIPEQSLIFLYGPQRTYKSFVVLDMLASLALGVDWQGHPTVGPRTVIYIAGEGTRGFKKRRRAQVYKQDDYVENLGFIDVMPRFAEVDQYRQFVEALAEVRPALIVIDTLSKAMVGRDISNPADAAQFDMQMLDIIRHLNCSIILVAHSGKDEKRGIKGASDYAQDADTVFQVSSHRDRFTTITMEKQKEAEEWRGPRAFEMVDAADSMVPAPASLEDAGASVVDQRSDALVHTVDAVLLASGERFKTPELAGSLVHTLHPELEQQDNNDWKELTKRQAKELNGLINAPGVGPLHKYVLVRGLGTNPHIWQHPDTRE